LRLEQERKDRKKAKEKERKERLKAEGKLLSSKQKADRARAEAMIEAMKAMYGGAAPPPGEKPKPKPFTKLKKKKQSGENGNMLLASICFASLVVVILFYLFIYH
jgi:translation initiation factor 5B